MAKQKSTYRSNSEDWIVNLVRTGMGVALMPEYTLPLNAGDVHCRYLCNPEISRQIYAIYYPHSHKKADMKALLSSLSNV